MSALQDVLDFYIKEAWMANDDGTMVPSAALLADRGVKAMSYKHAAPETPPPEQAVQACYYLAAGEIAEALRDIVFSMNMPHSEARTVKLGQACVTLQNAEYRIRSVTRS